MKNSTFLQGMRSLTLTGLVCLASLAVSAQTKTKTSTSTQTKAKTTATATPAKAKTATAATAKPKTYSASATTRKSTAAASTKKAPAKTVASAAPVKPVETAAAAPAPTPEVVSPAETKRQASAAFGGGSNVISFGIGLVHNLDYPKGGSRLMPLTFSYERGLNVAAGPGTIGVGGVFSYSHYKWGEGDYKWTVMYFGAKGAYHIDLAKNEKLDTYAGLNLGYARTKVNYDSYYYGSASEGEVKVGVLAGARYFFTENVGAHLELETGPMSHITLGLSYKF
ncbi:outer membrane protein [Rufibacter hautae]|uniref:Porin family protein n=1 Tax=Rufibacter hautae TaxID=2595005 RepID=A0A5B6TFN2_9BACT|nr:opacity family porin [Rufibacter hautae]KAA3439113.1 porin family protein [Rufibacter hautae]